jgi:type VII secretion protein EccB
MARQPTTRLQVSGYRFLVRRMEHALVRGDVRMLDDPLRAQSLSLIAGCIVAAIVVAGCAILAYLRPGGGLGGAPIVMDRDSGALYVRIDDSWHPVLNLASARLVAGTPANPEVVSGSAIESARRGPLVGIPGAPAVIADPLSRDESAWTVCDSATGTTVIVGHVRVGAGADTLPPEQSVLVRPRADSAAMTYLLYDGRRASIDLRDTAVVRALRLDNVVPRPVSRALLESIPEAPAITAPRIPQVGAPGPAALGGLTAGTVVRMARADASEYYVVLTDGVQRVGRVAADLVRFTVTQPGENIRTIAADAIAATRAVDELPVTTFPDHTRAVEPPVVCGHWAPDDGNRRISTSVLVGDSLPTERGQPGMALAQTDGDGPNVDNVMLPAGRSAYLRATGLTGDGGTAGPLYLMNDLGVLFGVRDHNDAEHLGISTPAVPAPWPVLALLPRGPELSKVGASVARDGIAPS